MNNMLTRLFGSISIVCLVILAGSTRFIHAQDDPSKETFNPETMFDLPWSADRIEGVWDARVNITVCNGPVLFSFDGLGLFGANGAFHDTNSTNPSLRSATFGYWKHIRGRSYKFAFKFFRFDLAGNLLGTQVVRHNVLLSGSGDTYTSSGTSETYNTNGELIATGCSNSTATRFR